MNPDDAQYELELKLHEPNQYKSKPMALAQSEAPKLYNAEEKLAESLKNAATEYLKIVFDREHKTTPAERKQFIDENLFKLGIPTALDQLMRSFDTDASIAACISFLNDLSRRREIKVQHVLDGEITIARATS